MTAPVTRAALVAAYRARLEATDMPWVQDAAKLDRFLAQVRDTLAGPHDTFSRGGTCWLLALADLGLPAKISLAKLRGLPA